MQMRIEDSEQPTHSKAVARTEPQPLANLKHQQASNVAAASSSASTRSAAVKTKQIGQHSVDVDRQQNLVSLLSRLQLLQEAGSQFAQRLHLSA